MKQFSLFPEPDSSEPQFDGLEWCEKMIKVFRAVPGCQMDQIILTLGMSFGSGEPALSQQHWRYITGPIVHSPSPWDDCVPTWVREAIERDRVDLCLTEAKQNKVGRLAAPSEVLMYLMPITYEVPLTHEWAQVYLWASYTTLKKHYALAGHTKAPDYYEMIGAKEIEFSSIEQRYSFIATPIRRRCVESCSRKTFTKTNRSTKQQQHSSSESVNRTDEVEYIQLSLFEEEDECDWGENDE